MRITTKLATIALLLFALFPAIAASADDCSNDPYCSPGTPIVGGHDDNQGGNDQGGNEQGNQGGDQQGANEEQGGGTTGSGGQVAGESQESSGGGAQVMGAEAEAPVGAAATAPTGS